MATSNVPRHDFAPAWLKIPSQENLKSAPSCKKQVGQSEKPVRLKKEETGGTTTGSQAHNSNRYNTEYSKLHRQHSFENYHENKRYINSQAKQRNHSVDDDDYSYPYGPPYGSYYNGYGPLHEKYGVQYGSQPSLLRPPSRQESGKYPHSVSRFNSPVSSGFPNYYYDVYPQDYYHGDAYYSPYQSRPISGRKTLSERDSRVGSVKGDESASKERDLLERSSKDSNREENVFGDEFPFLHGRDEVYDPSGYMTSNGNGVWDNSLLSKSESLFTKNDVDYGDYSGQREPDPSHPGDDIYKYFAPAEDIHQLSSMCDGENSSELAGQLETEGPAYNSENTPGQGRVVKSRGSRSFVCNSPQELVNGIDLLSVKDNGTSLLSSSLEAEQRLLREMGWNETEEEYVITEDDKKEFQKLTNQAKQQRNDLVRPLPKTWSPKHVLVYQPNAQDLCDVSSSDSDSEDSC